MATKNIRQKRAIAAKYARKEMADSGAMAAYGSKPRKVVRKRRAAPIYRTVPAARVVKGSGAYKFSNAGSDIGRGLGYGLDYILGRGAYEVKANSILQGVYDPPELHNRTDRTVCIRHREYITDIVASSAFTSQVFPINPGLVTTFPWLAQVAEAFEEYRFTGIVFEFKTLSADYTTASSAALGYVVMSTQYNVLYPPFPDKITMENYEFSNDGKPSVSFLHPVECKRSLNPVSELFVRTGIPTIGDLRLYDHGNFTIATGGNTGSGIIGELWCTYEIEFYKPKLVAAIGYELKTDHWYATDGITNTLLFGSDPILLPGSDLGTTITPATALVSFPPNLQDGYFMLIYTCSGDATALIGPGVTETNCAIINAWKVSQAVSNINNSGTTHDTYIQCFVVQVTAQNATIDFTTATMPANPTSMDLWIMQVNGGLF